MNKKITTGIMAGVMTVCFAAGAFAYPGDGQEHRRDGSFKGKPGYHARFQENMTEGQKKVWLDFQEKRTQLRIDFINNEIKAGRLSREVGNAQIVLIKDRFEKIKKGDFAPPARDKDSIDAREKFRRDMFDLKEKCVNDAVANGTITQDEANQMRGDRDFHRDGGPGRHHRER